MQLLYPGWQRAVSASRWALSNPCCPTALRSRLQPVGEKPCPTGAQGSFLSRARSPGHGETGSKWGPQDPEGRSQVSVHVQESDKALQSQTRLASRKMGISGRTDWEFVENMTLPEKEPFLTRFLSPSSFSGLIPQVTRVFKGASWRWKIWYLMLRVNTSPSWAPTTHTGKPSPCGTDSPRCPLSQEGLRTVNSSIESNTGLFHTFPRITLPSWWGLIHSSRGHLRSPHDPLQVTQQALVQPHSEQSALPSPRAWSQSQKWRLRALMLNAGSRSEASAACAHSWGETSHENLRSMSVVGGVQYMPRQNGSWSHVNPGLNTNQGVKSNLPPTFFFSSLTDIERTKKMGCVYIPCTMWPCDTCLHYEIFITIHEPIH